MIMDKFSLEGKKGIVTGAGQGLGKMFALSFADAGADVAVAEINTTTGPETADCIVTASLGFADQRAAAADAALSIEAVKIFRFTWADVSDATYYQWKSKYGGMEVSEAKRLRELEQENAKLKRLLAEAELDKAALKELVEGKW